MLCQNGNGRFRQLFRSVVHWTSFRGLLNDTSWFERKDSNWNRSTLYEKTSFIWRRSIVKKNKHETASDIDESTRMSRNRERRCNSAWIESLTRFDFFSMRSLISYTVVRQYFRNKVSMLRIAFQLHLVKGYTSQTARSDFKFFTVGLCLLSGSARSFLNG